MGGGNKAGFVRIAEDGRVQPNLLDPLTGIVDRAEAEFDEPTQMEDLNSKALGAHVASSSQPLLPSVPSVASLNPSMSILGKSPAICKPKVGLGTMERRKSVRNLIGVTSVKNKTSLRSCQISISEDDECEGVN
jgi:hypothetical protein